VPAIVKPAAPSLDDPGKELNAANCRTMNVPPTLQNRACEGLAGPFAAAEKAERDGRRGGEAG
jgi:hypothetical protein